MFRLTCPFGLLLFAIIFIFTGCSGGIQQLPPTSPAPSQATAPETKQAPATTQAPQPKPTPKETKQSLETPVASTAPAKTSQAPPTTISETKPTPAPTPSPKPNPSTTAPATSAKIAFSIVTSGAFTTLGLIDFKASTRATLPPDFEWVWYWGDGSAEELANPTDANTNHQFTKSDKYTVTLKLRSKTDNSILGTDSQDIIIDDFNALKFMSNLRFELKGVWVQGYKKDIKLLNIIDEKAPYNGRLNFYGENCSANWITQEPGGQKIHNIQIQVSDDRLTLLSANWSAETYQNGKLAAREKITAKNVPFENKSVSSFLARLAGDKVKDSVVYEYDSPGGLQKVDWSDPRSLPIFECQFIR